MSLKKFSSAVALATLLLAAILFAVSAVSGAQDAGKPSAEMAKLKFYLGKWEYAEDYPKSPQFPNGGKNSGIYTSELGPGGNSLINRFHSSGEVGTSEGLLIYTWDPRDQKYKMYLFGDRFPGAVVSSGEFEGDKLVFRSTAEFPGLKMELRNVTRLIAPDHIVSEQYAAANGAPEKLIVSVDAKRK